jgi:hypothetical protein
MVLFALCINTLIHSLENNLQGMRPNKGQRKVSVVAYADITILVTAKEDIEVLKEIIQCYERATGALLNVRKSQALAVGNWDSTRSVLGIPYIEIIKILGFQMTNNTDTSRRACWSSVTGKVMLHAREAYHRELEMSHRILYAHAYILAKIWHIAQIFPITACTTNSRSGGLVYMAGLHL